MKNSILILSIVPLLSFIPPSVWKEFNSYEGKFRVLAPSGEMIEKTSKMKTDLGELSYHQFIHKTDEKNADNVFYLVNYCDYPKGSFPKDSTELIQEFLDATVDSSIKSVSGELTYQSDIQILTHKGKIWRVQYNKGNVSIKNKCYLVGDRFYLLQVMTLKQHTMNPLVDKFLDSFNVF